MAAKLALGLLLGLACLAAQAQQAGLIELSEGEVNLTDAKARPRKAGLGETIRQGDTIATGKDGEVHLKLEDGSVLALRPDARMTIVQFQNKGKASDRSIVALARGALRTITGWIGRRHPERVQISTATATIGIRGTDHEAFVILPGSDLGEAGTYDKVNAGGTRIESERGTVEVSPGQAGFASAAAAPVVLPSVPAFFQPTRNEGRLEGQHDAIQRSLSAPGAAPAGGSSRAMQVGGKGGVQIQGNTRINAVGKNSSAVAVGSDNQAQNEIGTIGK